MGNIVSVRELAGTLGVLWLFKQNERVFVRLQETHMHIMHLHKFICVLSSRIICEQCCYCLKLLKNVIKV